MPTPPDSRLKFLEQLTTAVNHGRLEKLTLGKPFGPDASLRKLLVRPVTLRNGPMLSFVWRHTTKDITKNHPLDEGLALIAESLTNEFLDAHLFSSEFTAQFEGIAGAGGALHVRAAATNRETPAPNSHDRSKTHVIEAHRPWLQALGITNEQGRPREGMAGKYRQIQKFAELFQSLVLEAFPAGGSIRVEDMGSGKGYLTFTVAELLGERGQVTGIEARPELVELCNRVARLVGLAPRLTFSAGEIAAQPEAETDVLIALHACDTATDDALARGIASGAKLLVVSPCCQKELRGQLVAPPVLAAALRHGIFQERQAEFVTDALRAELLEWAGYRTKVFEFISTEHTAKNLMIAAIKTAERGTSGTAESVRSLAAFYGIRHQRLAAQLGFALDDRTASHATAHGRPSLIT